MAKFNVTYELHLGDLIEFKTFDNQILQGRVQDISEFPEFWVEVEDPRSSNYRRYHLSINSIIDVLYSSDSYWKESTTVFEPNEDIEYTYSEDLRHKIYTEYGK